MTIPNSNSGFLALVVTTWILFTDAFRNADQPVRGIPKWADETTTANAKIIGSSSSLLVPTPNAETLEIFAAFANQLADVAQKEIEPYWRQGRHALGQQIKLEEGRSLFQTASPVTLADRAAERAMRDLITSHFPDHGIYGEEFGIKDADADWVW